MRPVALALLGALGCASSATAPTAPSAPAAPAAPASTTASSATGDTASSAEPSSAPAGNASAGGGGTPSGADAAAGAEVGGEPREAVPAAHTPVAANTQRPAPGASGSGEPAEPDTRALELVEGSWKITRVISLGSAHHKTTVPATTECLTKGSPFPDARPGLAAKTYCESAYGVEGSVVTWTFSCSADTTTIDGTGTLTFRGKQVTGSIALDKQTSDGASMAGVRGVMKLTGTYVGPCT